MKRTHLFATWLVGLSIGGSLGFVAPASAQSPYTVGWGWNGDKQASPVPTNVISNVTAIAGGYKHSLAIENGRTWAWGNNTYGQTNVPVAAQSGVTQIDGGVSFSLALKTNGAVIAWGAGIIATNVPTSLTGGVTQVAAGDWHALALQNGGVVAWGSNTYGQTDVPAALTSGVTAVDAGAYYGLALKDGGVQVFGIPATNPLAYSIRSVPSEAGSGVTAIAAGTFHALALKDGGVIAWGEPYQDATNVPAEATSGVTAIGAGEDWSVALKADGTMVFWGDGTKGQYPVPAFASNDIAKVAAGGGHVLATGPVLPARIVVLGPQLPDAYRDYEYTNGFISAVGDPAVRYSFFGSRPSWLTLNATNGVLGGTATNLGTYALTVVVSNVYGQMTNAFSITVLERPLGAPIFLTTNPLPSGVVGAPYAQQIVTTNGGVFSLVEGEGDLPAGLALDSTGWITGTPTTVESLQFTVRATNLVGSSNRVYNLSIVAPEAAPVFVTTNPLPSGVVGEPYSLQIVASNYPTGFGLMAGAMPVGLGLTAAGWVTGTPVQVESANFTVEATNVVGGTNAIYDLQILGPPAFVTESPLPDGSLDVPYSQQIVATGDAVFSLAGGTLPGGVALGGDGWLTGTPTNTGLFTFTVLATNAYGSTNREFDLVVGAMPTFTTASPLPSGQVGTPYSQQIVATGSPIFSVFDGSLPDGLDLSGAGLLSGTPTAAGAFNFTVRATNDYGWSNRTYDVTILGQEPPSFTAIRVTNGNVRLAWTNPNGSGNVQVWYTRSITNAPVVWSNLGVQVSPWTNVSPTNPSYYQLRLVP